MITYLLALSPQIRITALYLVIASAWILFSDNLLYHLFTTEIDRLANISTLKGMFFVLTTAGLLYAHLRYEFAQRFGVEAELTRQMQAAAAAQALLADSEARFRKAIEYAPLPILMFADDGEVLAISRAWLEITGYRADQLTTLDSWTRLAYGERQGAVRAVIDRLFDLDGRADEGEFVITCQDGSQRTWEFSSAPLGRLPDGRRIVISMAFDVTERNRIRRERDANSQFLQTLIQAAPLGITVFDPAGIVQLWNPAAERLLGWSAAEVIGGPLPYIRPQDQQEFRGLRDRVAAGETLVAHEVQRQHKDGYVIDLSISAGPLYDASGAFIGVLGMIKDISERKQAEAALRDSEARFRQLVEAAPVAIFIRTDAHFAYLNPKALLLFGAASADQLLGQPVLERFHPDYHDIIKQRLHILNEDRREVIPMEQVYLRLDGTPFDVEVFAVPFTYDDQPGALVFFHDITARKQAEAALQESERRFRQLAENINEVFYLNDAAKREMLYISPAYETIWGRSRASLYANPLDFLEAVHPDDRDQVQATFADQRQGRPTEVTYRLIRPDRSIRWVRSRAFPVLAADGTLERIAGVVEDITDKVMYENQLRRLAQRLVRGLDSERARIARELHDQVGQQLTALGINLGVLLSQCGDDYPLRPVISDSADLVENTIARIRLIISDLRPPVLDDMGLAAGLRWYCEKFTRRTRIPVTLEVAPDAAALAPMIDNTLYQIAQEALTNTAKYASATQVWIRLWAEGDRLILSIRDNGSGFAPDERLYESSPEHWGLQIMRERVRAIVGARLTIDSAPGEGTEVRVEVPL